MVELYCDLDGLLSPGGESILADVMVQAQRPNLVILDRSVHGRHRIALVELTCPWETDAKRAKEHKTARYADLKTALINEGWDCSLYMIEGGVWLRTAFGRYPGLGSLRPYVRYWEDDERCQQDFFCVSVAILQARNDPVWFSPYLVMQHIDEVPTVK
jgi:hypothetical protein